MVPEISGDELFTFSDGPIPLTSTVGKEIGEGCRWWSCQDPLNPIRVTWTYLYITPQAWQLFGVIIPRSPSLIEKIQVVGLLFSICVCLQCSIETITTFLNTLGSVDIAHTSLGGGFKYFLFSPLPGEMIQFD